MFYRFHPANTTVGQQVLRNMAVQLMRNSPISGSGVSRAIISREKLSQIQGGEDPKSPTDIKTISETSNGNAKDWKRMSNIIMPILHEAHSAKPHSEILIDHQLIQAFIDKDTFPLPAADFNEKRR